MAHQAVGSIADVRGSGTDGVVEIGLVDRAGVVGTEGLVVVAVLGLELLQAVAVLGALGAVADHLEDAAGGVVGVELGAVVGLHQARVADAVVGLAGISTVTTQLELLGVYLRSGRGRCHQTPGR